MNAKSRGVPIVAAVALLALTQVVGAGETELRSDEVPEAVRDSLQAHYPGAKYLGFSMETGNGSSLYEAEMNVAGRRIDALLDSVGTFQEIETEVHVSELPEAVRTALRESEFAEGRIENAESHAVPGSGKEPDYELLVELKGETYELVYSSRGALKRSEPLHEGD